MGTLEMTTLAGSRVPSRLSINARDSPTPRSDDSAGPGTPVKSRSLCSLSVKDISHADADTSPSTFTSHFWHHFPLANPFRPRGSRNLETNITTNLQRITSTPGQANRATSAG